MREKTPAVSRMFLPPRATHRASRTHAATLSSSTSYVALAFGRTRVWSASQKSFRAKSGLQLSGKSRVRASSKPNWGRPDGDQIIQIWQPVFWGLKVPHHALARPPPAPSARSRIGRKSENRSKIGSIFEVLVRMSTTSTTNLVKLLPEVLEEFFSTLQST